MSVIIFDQLLDLSKNYLIFQEKICSRTVPVPVRRWIESQSIFCQSNIVQVDIIFYIFYSKKVLYVTKRVIFLIGFWGIRKSDY